MRQRSTDSLFVAEFKYFKPDELVCQHCGEYGMDEEFMHHVDRLRHITRIPFNVSSAYRCPDHPIEAAKHQPGTHSMGIAIDISCGRDYAHKILEAVFFNGYPFTGIGVSQKEPPRFIHLDTYTGDNWRARPSVWSY